MLDFFMQNNKISDKQFRFLPGRSCTLQLLYCVHKWINELENNHTVAVFYTDFRTAFDSVSHRKLIRRLEMLGIVVVLLKSLRSENHTPYYYWLNRSEPA